jgi:endoplasmic reticulum Man9GlcNAc2 1,2-alpha-mannosidase
VESLFIAYRLTGDQKYRNWGWDIFSALEEHCKVPDGGYAAILNVDGIPVEHEDKMETFLMVSTSVLGGKKKIRTITNVYLQSETLKYLFLLFSDTSVLPLDRKYFYLSLSVDVDHPADTLLTL